MLERTATARSRATVSHRAGEWLANVLASHCTPNLGLTRFRTFRSAIELIQLGGVHQQCRALTVHVRSNPKVDPAALASASGAGVFNAHGMHCPPSDARVCDGPEPLAWAASQRKCILKI